MLRTHDFPLPKLMRRRGIPLTVASDMPWQFELATPAQLKETDVNTVLDLAHPLLIALMLAGYRVDRCLFSTLPNGADHVLHVGLPNHYSHVINYASLMPGFTHWEEITNVLWSGSLESNQSDALPHNTSIALALQMTPRLGADGLDMNVPLDLSSTSNVLVNADDTWLVVYSTDGPYDNNWSIQFVADILQPLVTSVRDKIKDELEPRWLTVDGAPKGLVNHLSPDMLDVVATELTASTAIPVPTRWGVRPAPLTSDGKWRSIGEPHQKIINEARLFWHDLLKSVQTFDDYYHLITEVESETLWKNVHLPAAFNPNIYKQAMTWFHQSIQQLYGSETGTPLPDAFIVSLAKLPWLEVLLLLHDAYVIDILSGVSVTGVWPSTADAIAVIPCENAPLDTIQPVVYPQEARDIRSEIEPDFTGFYFEKNGTRALQINQGGQGETGPYWRGYMQENVDIVNNSAVVAPAGWHRRLLVLAERNISTDPENPLIRKVVQLPDQTMVYEIDHVTHQFVGVDLEITLHLVTGQGGGPSTLVFSRDSVYPYISDDGLAQVHRMEGVPDITEANLHNLEYVAMLAQRFPLHPDEYPIIQAIVEGPVRGYIDTRPSMVPSEITEQALRDAMAPYITFDEYGDRDGLPRIQYPLVQVVARQHARGTGLDPDNPNETRSIWQALIETVIDAEDRSQHVNVPQDNMIIDFFDITDEELANPPTPPQPPSDGEYVYQWRLQQQGVGGSFYEVLGAGIGWGTLQVKTSWYEPYENINPWSAVYVGYLLSGSIGLGFSLLNIISPVLPDINFGSDSGWNDIKTDTPWTMEDFAGNLTINVVQASEAVGTLSVSKTLHNTITFYRGAHEIGEFITSDISADGGGFALKVGAEASTHEGRFLLIDDVYEIGFYSRLVADYYLASSQTTQSVHFEVCSAKLKDEGKQILRDIAAVFRAHLESPLTKLEIVGHASREGNDTLNDHLSWQRARSVYNFFYTALGESFKVPTNSTKVYGVGAFYANQHPDDPLSSWRKVDILVNGMLIGQV